MVPTWTTAGPLVRAGAEASAGRMAAGGVGDGEGDGEGSGDATMVGITELWEAGLASIARANTTAASVSAATDPSNIAVMRSCLVRLSLPTGGQASQTSGLAANGTSNGRSGAPRPACAPTLRHRMRPTERPEGAGMQGTFTSELSFALELAAESDEIAMRWFAHDPDVSTKEDGSLVTVADREIEQLLRRRIHDRFPADGVLGEEGGLEPGESDRLWILDPIDGTNNYAWGIPIFGTLIGLRVGGRTVAGVVSAPALGERYDAASGAGARMNGSPIAVSAASTVEDARICYASWYGWDAAGLADRWLSILTRCRRSRGFGDFWGHMLVARGAADAMAEPELRTWDVAALEVIVEEAGGRLTTLSGDPWGRVPPADLYDVRQSCLTTNGGLHSTLLSELSGA